MTRRHPTYGENLVSFENEQDELDWNKRLNKWVIKLKESPNDKEIATKVKDLLDEGYDSGYTCKSVCMNEVFSLLKHFL